MIVSEASVVLLVIYVHINLNITNTTNIISICLLNQTDPSGRLKKRKCFYFFQLFDHFLSVQVGAKKVKIKIKRKVMFFTFFKKTIKKLDFDQKVGQLFQK